MYEYGVNSVNGSLVWMLDNFKLILYTGIGPSKQPNAEPSLIEVVNLDQLQLIRCRDYNHPPKIDLKSIRRRHSPDHKYTNIDKAYEMMHRGIPWVLDSSENYSGR